MNIRRHILIGMGLLMIGTGCAQKFTRQHFDMIEVGFDDRESVEKLLGKPRTDATGEWYYVDDEQSQHARVFFDGDGRVRGKEWMNADTGEWQGENPDAAPASRGDSRGSRNSNRRVDR
ncbi:MAG: outer membrane protein assembly factor BamE [Phycisphaerales bacterium]|nr:outer membrane protein assembly factor BamE [Phycisphaerales bacterium]